jgi:hypothetical protein
MAACAACVCASSASAQSSITVSGIVDLAARHAVEHAREQEIKEPQEGGLAVGRAKPEEQLGHSSRAS